MEGGQNECVPSNWPSGSGINFPHKKITFPIFYNTLNYMYTIIYTFYVLTLRNRVVYVLSSHGFLFVTVKLIYTL